MSSAAVEARTQAASARTASPRSPAKSVIGPKLVAGIGLTLTIAAVAAVVTLSGEPSAPSAPPAAPVQTAYASPAAPPPAEVATAAPVAAAPAMFVAPPAVAPAPVAQTQCGLVQRKFYIAGNGIIRVRDGGFVSAPVVLGPYPQEILMDLPRPASGFSAPETIVVEGRATTVVMTSDLPGFHMVINRLRGTSSFDVQWAPLKNC